MTAEQVIFLCVFCLLAVVIASVVGYYATRRPTAARLLARLQKDLPELQSEFFASGQKRGLPRGMLWKGVDWQSEQLLALDRTNREAVALVAVTLDLESQNSSGQRERWNASALFHFVAGRWQTLGKAVFNHSPSEVLERLSDQFARYSDAVAEEIG